jgi:transcriptional regulator with XRE-family HTH domain
MVGLQVKRLRQAQKLTQPMLVARCNLLGWGISRETLAKIESQIRWVADFEAVCLSKALKVPLETLLPDQSKTALKPFLKL